MTGWLIAGGILIYIIGSYVLVYRFLKKSPGPAGLGMLALPAAPLFGPLFLWEGFKALCRWIGR